MDVLKSTPTTAAGPRPEAFGAHPVAPNGAPSGADAGQVEVASAVSSFTRAETPRRFAVVEDVPPGTAGRAAALGV